MNKLLLLLPAIILSISSHAQVDCNSTRFDQEVFSTVNVTSNVVYGSNVDANGTMQTLKMDIYEPANDTMAARPLIVWAHGGSFLAGSKLDNDVTILCQRFAKRGYVCVSIDYRLGIPLPIGQVNATKAVYRATQDMKAAIRYFRQDAATANIYKIDPNTIFAGGSSAGAFIALHLAYLNKVSEIPAAIDTTVMGGLEGNTGNPGYPSNVNAAIDLCGALGDRTWIEPGDIPFVAMHGTNDNTVPYGRAIIYLIGAFPIMTVDGSFSVAGYADTVGVYNQMYTFYGSDHVPYASSTAYMDTTVKFVSNFLFYYLGCSPADPTPVANTFTTAIASLPQAINFTLFPNPATDLLTISSDEKIIDLQLMNIQGQTIASYAPSENSLVISTAALPRGIYFAKARVGNKTMMKKVVFN